PGHFELLGEALDALQNFGRRHYCGRGTQHGRTLAIVWIVALRAGDDLAIWKDSRVAGGASHGAQLHDALPAYDPSREGNCAVLSHWHAGAFVELGVENVLG